MVTSPLRALAVGFSQDLKQLEILDANQKSVGKLSLRLRRYSQEFQCPIVNEHLVFGVEDGVDEFGNKKYRPVSAVKWNPSYQKTCLIFIPQEFQGNNAGKEPYKIVTMNMDPKTFRPGHTRVANFSPAQTLFRIGEHKQVVESGQIATIEKVNELKRMNMAQVEVYYSFEGKANNILQTRVRYLDQTRYFAIIYPDFLHRKIRVAIAKDYGNLF